MALSLFGGKNHLHIVAELDAVKELFALLAEARICYLRDVVARGKSYFRYTEDFVNSHRYIDCNRVICRNCHEMNIHIVQGILNGNPLLIQSLFIADNFSFKKCLELKRRYDKPVPQSVPDDCRQTNPVPPLSLDCSLTPEQMVGIVSCANAYRLFCTPVTLGDMESLFTCKAGFSLRVNNIRHVAILFDALLEHSFIQAQWQTVLGKGKFLQTKDGKGSVSASSLSSALSAMRNHMTSAAYGIKRAIHELKWCQ